jgi:hypothetical protein
MRSITTDFFWFCCGCLVVSLAYVSIVRDFSFEFVTYGVSKFAILALSMVTGPWIPLAVPLIVLMIWRDRPRALETLGAGLGTIILSVAFAMSKSAIPTVVPFWADPILTDIDMLIFNGQHAYQWVHTMGAGWLDPTGAADSYVQTWGALTLFFPVILTAADSNIERRQRYLMVYGLMLSLEKPIFQICQRHYLQAALTAPISTLFKKIFGMPIRMTTVRKLAAQESLPFHPCTWLWALYGVFICVSAVSFWPRLASPLPQQYGFCPSTQATTTPQMDWPLLSWLHCSFGLFTNSNASKTLPAPHTDITDKLFGLPPLMT